jgi:hypothetical protein
MVAIKWMITLTWSKIMAAIIFLSGLIFGILIFHYNQSAGLDKATEVFLTCTIVSAGLLGWRQAATTVRTFLNGKANGGNDNGVSKESAPLPVAEP